ncbi:uncharacterized protein K452DRAFT_302392 [Aplosporella prunicola CBS 121167]|uniref:Major facilitator superfamily (MFS) profile domain-containing protein n=1 Tax=Aplosporella prunicola CBS 121167 TaxID=1176127 RepID=A0A6A6B0W3_9PEZI|nr:uncharacterized protein K452DRAFT_302392 [Aplosporella prunicola CBS 121167]KAF2136895.1 hypothetical protein K452DRAFT_302392 [Aplosporella prunicola CBS 121167]
MADPEFSYEDFSDTEQPSVAPVRKTKKTPKTIIPKTPPKTTPKTTTPTEKSLNVIVDHTHSPDSEQGSQLSAGVRLAPDGTTPLVPQPSADPQDPLNWSWAKKHAVLLALIPGCLLSDWALTWGSTVFELQAQDWDMAVQAVSNSLSPGIFMQAPGGILAVPLCQRYGRLPVLFWSQLLSLAVIIGATLAPTYGGFTACRALQGFFGAAPQVIGLSVIHDMFFFHERARKINIWAASFLIGPYIGPFISSLILLKLAWRPDFAVLAGFYAFSVLAVLLLGDETLFDRGGALGLHQSKSKRKTTRLALLVGLAGLRAKGRPKIRTVLRHQLALLARPYLLLPSALFLTPLTMWTIGLVSTIPLFTLPPPPPAGTGYAFSYLGFALLYLAPIVGTLLAEAYGHYANDLILRRHLHKHNHTQHAPTTLPVPEARLTAVYPPLTLGVAGLVLFGQTLQQHHHWAALAVAWGMVTFATLATTTPISAYVLDTFPLHAAPAAAWLNAWRVVGGFSVVYFQLGWVARAGPGVAFGCQGAVIAAVGCAVVVTQRFGRAWRERWPVPEGEN